MKQNHKAQRLARKEFLRQKRENLSKTEQLLEAGDHSSSVMKIRNHASGRARKVRRGS